jgi:hypothetical protein
MLGSLGSRMRCVLEHSNVWLCSIPQRLEPSSHCEACKADIHQPACTSSMPPCWLHASCDVAGPLAHDKIIVLLKKKHSSWMEHVNHTDAVMHMC